MFSAQATIETVKASRYLKALCNHFNRKVTAEYDDNHGLVQFGFGTCEMVAEAGSLIIRVQSSDGEDFARVKSVVASHLERFSGDEKLPVSWIETC